MTVVAAYQNNNNKENNKNDIQTQKKKVMEASELLSKHARGRGIRALTSDMNSSNTNESTGRKNSTVMKYSSISPSESSRSRPRLPSAKTITRQCFPIESSSSSTTSSPDSLLVDSSNDNNTKHEEAYVLDKSIASPTSRQIMQEVSKIYEASPVPRSYLESPHKKSPIITSGNNKKVSLHHSAGGKIELEASDLLAKQQKSRRRPPNNKGIANTKAAYGGSSSGRSLSADVKFSTNNNNNNKKKPIPLAVQREKQQRKERLKEAKNAPKHEVDGRRNLDKRTARLRYGEAFAGHTLQYRQQNTYLNNGTNHSDKVDNEIQSRSQNGVSIVVRKRPIFDYELERGDYDIVSIDNTTLSSNDVTIVHNGFMHAGKSAFVLFCHASSNVQYEVSMIWLIHLTRSVYI